MAMKELWNIADEESCKGISDETLKEVYGKDLGDKIIEDFARINAIDFKYKPEVQEKYDGTFGVDDAEHVGIIAQELEQVDATKGAVKETEEGNKVVDSRHLAFADTAAIAELSRRVIALEEVVNELLTRNQ